jgi:hypothetical protein
MEIKMKTDLLQLLQRNLITRDSLPLKIKKRKNLNTFKGPVAPNLRREGETLKKKRCFQKKKSQKYKNEKKKIKTGLNFLNIMPELEKLPKIKK